MTSTTRAAVADARRIVLGPLAGNPFPDATPAFFSAMAEALSRGLTQKMLHGAMAELHAGDAESRERARHAIEHFFLRGNR